LKKTRHFKALCGVDDAFYFILYFATFQTDRARKRQTYYSVQPSLGDSKLL